MVVRKPYAFLIKNFRKIHIFLLVLSLLVAHRLIKINSFVNEFMRLGIYDSYLNPITKYITIPLMFLIFVAIIGSGALIILLKYKNKPWKLYLVPFIEYLALFIVLGIIKNFFIKATYSVATTDIRMSRDLLLILLIGQLPAIAIFIMRSLGMDTQKFHFNLDEEYLEISEDDREEIEISFDIDTNSFKRAYKRLFRNIEYFYNEHKIICKVIIGVIGVVILYNTYKFIFVTNKVYKQGDTYSVNGYTMKIKNSYFTDKADNGDIISKDSNFVIVEIQVTNNSAPRKLDINRFHLKNRTEDYTTTEKTYENEFQDLGKCYDSVKELKRDETFNFIVIYKVKKKLSKNGFALYYQEEKKLRRIRLSVKDVSKIKNSKNLKLGENLEFNLKNVDHSVSLDSYSFNDSINYTIRSCTVSTCKNKNFNYKAKNDNKILKIDFASNDFEGKDMIDFSIKYGKIVYKNSKHEDETVDFKYPFDRTAMGKYIYTLVPSEMEDSESIEIDYVIRNMRYRYILK